MSIVEIKNVTRAYTSSDHKVKALDGVNLTLDEGKFVPFSAVYGCSTLYILFGE